MINSIFDLLLTLIALSITPKRITQIKRDVDRALKRSVDCSTITRALHRAADRGAACETVLGWAEPIDELSPMTKSSTRTEVEADNQS